MVTKERHYIEWFTPIEWFTYTESTKRDEVDEILYTYEHTQSFIERWISSVDLPAFTGGKSDAPRHFHKDGTEATPRTRPHRNQVDAGVAQVSAED